MNKKAKRISSVAAICLAMQTVLNIGFSLAVSGFSIDKKGSLYFVCVCALSIISNVISALILMRTVNDQAGVPERRPTTKAKRIDNIITTVGVSALVFAVGLIYERIFPDAAADIPVGTDTSALRHIILIISLCITPALCEEFFFREVLARGLSVAGTTAAVIVSSMAFALAHLSASMFPYAFFAGLMFGFLFFRTKNVKYTVAAHFFCNFTSYLFALAKSAVPKGTYATLELVTMISFSAAAILIFCLDSRKTAAKAETSVEKADAVSVITPAILVYFAGSTLIILFL